METQIIGIKQLYTGLKDITEQVRFGQSFLVVKNSKPVFRIEPVEKTVQPRKKYTLKDLEKITFSSDDPDLSKKVDEIVYGV